jgi:hypothetical protein
VSTFHALINRFLEDRSALGPVELEALIDGLRSEPAWAVALREQLMVDDLLAQKLTLDRRNFLAQVEQRIVDFERTEADIDVQVAELRELATKEFASKELNRPSLWAAPSTWVRAGLALSLVAIVLGFIFAPRWAPEAWLPRQRLPVATVVTLRGAASATENDAETPLAESARLFTGQQIQTPEGGSLTLEYDDKSQLRVSGGSLLTLGLERGSGAKRIHMTRGELWADITSQAAGAMEISTPHALAIVLGTQLRVTVTQSETLLEVTEGLVRLDRLDRQESIDVAASQSGLATDASLVLRNVTWPVSTDELAYAFDPFIRRVPRARKPVGDGWYSSPSEIVGSAAVNELSNTWDLSGGYFRSREDGEDIVLASRESSEFSLELVCVPAANSLAPAGRAVGLEAGNFTTNFALSQAGDDWTFVLRTTGADKPATFAWHIPAAGDPSTGSSQESAAASPLHLTFTYGGGQVLAYRNGNLIKPGGELNGSLAAWTPATLLIGANGRGKEVWQGTIHALAIYHRCLDAGEVAQNVQIYRRLAARQP